MSLLPRHYAQIECRCTQVRRLQRLAGNQAVQRLVQAKLSMSRPGDRYEREADRVANAVVRQINHARRQPNPGSAARYRRGIAAGPLRAVGRGLPGTVRCRWGRAGCHARYRNRDSEHTGWRTGSAGSRPAPMEQAFGVGFNDLRIHTDTRSDSLNRSLHAHAFPPALISSFARANTLRRHMADAGCWPMNWRTSCSNAHLLLRPGPASCATKKRQARGKRQPVHQVGMH